MFLCPVTSCKLRSAFARGVNIWYSPESQGRMITFAAARKLIGEDAVGELWVRSEVKSEGESWKKCPSCSKYLKIVTAPKWAGEYEVDVCRNCHLIWLDQGKFPQVPHEEDLLTNYGDASLVTSIAKERAQVYVEQDKLDNPALIGEGPEAFWKRVPAILGFPVEMEDARKEGIGWMTLALAVVMILIHVLISGDGDLLRSWGFEPANSLKHFGLTFFTYGFLHADWFHLLSNLYFFGVFADDVEIYYGQMKFFLFIGLCLFFSSFVTLATTSKPDIFHVGMSGVISALMVNYGLIYRKSRIAFLMPYFHTLGNGGFVRAIGWYRIPAFWVIAFYVAKDLFYYFLMEKNGLTNVSHSGHLQGAFFGVVFWIASGCPNWYYDSVPGEAVPVEDKLLPYK